jgi:GT2 family glycosyltransferase
MAVDLNCTKTSQHAVLICTRNRPDYLRELFDSLRNQTKYPSKIVVVDSSENSKTEELVAKYFTDGVVQCTYLRSEPGLPHQRNVGLRELQTLGWPLDSIVSFLDDDVHLKATYLENVAGLFTEYPDVKFVGGFAESSEVEPDNLARRVALLSAKHGAGKVLKSGICLAARPISDLEEVDWVPGHSMNARLSIFEQTLFNPGPRMYGEDVEFQLRLASRNRIYSSNRLPVSHKQAPTNRDQLASQEAYSDGFRWSLACRRLGGVRGWAVLWATLCMVTVLAFRALARRDEESAERLKGHLMFFKRVASGRETQQLLR